MTNYTDPKWTWNILFHLILSCCLWNIIFPLSFVNSNEWMLISIFLLEPQLIHTKPHLIRISLKFMESYHNVVFHLLPQWQASAAMMVHDEHDSSIQQSTWLRCPFGRKRAIQITATKKVQLFTVCLQVVESPTYGKVKYG